MEGERIKGEGGEDEWKEKGGEKGKAVLLVEVSGGCVGRRGVRCQKSGTATQLCFGVEGPSRLVSLSFIVREKKGTETLETL